MKKCPVCGVSVKVENLERHVGEQHPHADFERRRLLTGEERRDLERTKTARRPVLTQRGRRLILIVAIVLGAILVLVIANPFRGLGPGGVAPDFSVITSDGTSLRLSSLRGTPVLLEFMDPDCPACQLEAPTLVSLYGNYSTSVRFVSIDVNFVGAPDTDAKLNAYRSSYGASWPFALDTQGIRNAYGVTSTPTTSILDRAGVIVAVVHPPSNTYAGYASHLDRALG